MKKLIISFVLSVALLSFCSTAEATTKSKKLVPITTLFNNRVALKPVTTKRPTFKVVPASIDLRERTSTHKSHPLTVAGRWVGSSEHKSTRQLKSFMGVDPRRVPWCAGFVNAVLKKAGKPTTGSLAAASYLKYGKRTNTPSPGDIVVLRNSRGNHVGFYVGTVTVKGKKYVKVLSGNQNNAVTYKLYPARSVVQYRRS